jgi:flagellar protein FlaG
MDVNSIGNTVTAAVQFSPGATSPAVAASQEPVSTPVPVSAAATGTVVSGQTQGNPSQKTTSPSLADVQKAVDNINASLAAKGNSDAVQFAVDPSSKRVVVQVLDPQTGKVIRQVPSEEIIQMGMVLGQKLGQVINQQA